MIVSDDPQESKIHESVLSKIGLKVALYDIQHPPVGIENMKPKFVLLHITKLPGPALKTYFRKYNFTSAIVVAVVKYSLRADAEFAYNHGIDHYILKSRLLESHLKHIIDRSIYTYQSQTNQSQAT